jgi:sigma-B regulation protein RsbU (phosphoserine phosphatase)
MTDGLAIDLEDLLEDDPERLYDRAPCGYLSTSPDGLIRRANRTFALLCGHRVDELVGHVRFDELLPPGGRIYHETHFAPMLAMQGGAREIAFDLLHRSGRRIPVLVTAVLERDEVGRSRLIRMAIFDATQRRAYERELLEAKLRAEASDARATALARTLQQTLIPPAPPRIDGLDVASVFESGTAGLDIGGDFFDFFQTGPDEWDFVIGDVCGKGPEAAVITALARFTVRAEAMQHSSPAQVFAITDRVLRSYDTKRFCTATMLRLRRDGAGWVGEVSRAGHSAPLVRRANGALETLTASGSLLGVLSTPHFADAAVRLGPGDVVVLYTDGLVEARRGEEFYDEERAARVLGRGHVSAEAVATALLDDMHAFADVPGQDDVALLVLRVPD